MAGEISRDNENHFHDHLLNVSSRFVISTSLWALLVPCIVARTDINGKQQQHNYFWSKDEAFQQRDDHTDRQKWKNLHNQIKLSHDIIWRIIFLVSFEFSNRLSVVQIILTLRW